MTPEQVVQHYGSQTAAAAALGYGQSSVANWIARGKVPALSQLKLEILTGGKLKADPDILAVEHAEVRGNVSRD